MATRRQFRNVTDSLVSQFVSRNNDVDGYWSIGYLAGEMQRQAHLSLDLLSPQTAATVLTRTLATRFAARLTVHLQQRGLPPAWLTGARLTLGHTPTQAPNTYLIHVTALITDDLDHLWAATRSTEARPHDPKRELQSARGSHNRTL